MSSWYSLSWRAMSCLALCSASSRSLMRALASFTAPSPRTSASFIWSSRLTRWKESRVRWRKHPVRSKLVNHPFSNRGLEIFNLLLIFNNLVKGYWTVWLVRDWCCLRKSYFCCSWWSWFSSFEFVRDSSPTFSTKQNSRPINKSSCQLASNPSSSLWTFHSPEPLQTWSHFPGGPSFVWAQIFPPWCCAAHFHTGPPEQSSGQTGASQVKQRNKHTSFVLIQVWLGWFLSERQGFLVAFVRW